MGLMPGIALRASVVKMLRHKLLKLHTTVQRLGSQRLPRQALACVPRRTGPVACSQRSACVYAFQPFTSRSSVCTTATVTDRHSKVVHDSNGTSPAGLVGVPSLTFQEAITALEQYWAKLSGSNCAILLPHNTEARAHS